MITRTTKLLVVCLLLAGCDRLAFEPLHGRLQASWTVNQLSECVVPKGVPVLAKVQIRNVYRWRVRVPKQAAPSIPGAAGVSWKLLRPLPPTIAAGAEVEGWWLLEGDLPAGRYEVNFADAESSSGSGGVVVIRDEPIPAPLLLEQRAMVAKLSGTAGELAAELLRQPEAEMLPSTRLVIADLLHEAGQTESAAVQLEAFAERIYGAEALPNWLQSRMKRVSTSPDPNRDNSPDRR